MTMGERVRGVSRRDRLVRSFRPTAEACERRDLAAGLAPGHGLAVEAARLHHAEVLAERYTAYVRAHSHATAPAVAASTGNVATGVVAPAPGVPTAPAGSRPGIGPGLGKGLVRLALPYSYGDFGIVTLWNNTSNRVGFNASASTYQGGRSQFFVLNPGQYKSFYASVVNGTQPAFTFNFGAAGEVVTTPLDNIVFEGPGFVPSGTAGYPYAINDGVNGYYLSYI